MPSLSSIVFKHLASRGARGALTVLAVALGTSVAMAAFTTYAGVDESLRQAALAMVGDADLVVEALDEEGFPAGAVSKVQQVPGVTLVSPLLQKRVFFRTSGQRGFVQLMGVDPTVDSQIRRYRLAAGRPLQPREDAAVLLVKGWAEKVGLGPGAQIELMTRDGFRGFEVVGLLDEADLSSRTYGGLVRVPITVAQSTFGMGDRVHILSLQVRDRAQVEAIKQDVALALNQPMVVRETSRILDELATSMRELQIALLFFAAVALLLGGLLIFNTLSLTVSQQVRQIGLLRAAGVLSRTIMLISLGQGLLFGVIGALLGVAMGQGLATPLLWILGLVQGGPTRIVGPPVAGVVGSLAVGLGFTLAASILPALRAGRVSPLAALGTGSAAETGEGSPRPTQSFVAGAAILLVILFVVAPIPGEGLRLMRFVSLVVLFPLSIYVSRSLVPLLAPVAAIPMRRLARAASVLALTNVQRERNQASLTVAGFIVSFALVIALTNGSLSFSTAGQRWAESLFPGQFLVVSPVDQPPELVEEFKVPGVEFATGVSIVPVVWRDLQLTAAGVDPSQFLQAFEFRGGERVDAFTQMRRGPTVFVPHRLAEDRRIRVGDSLTLASAQGEGTFKVGGILAHSLPTADNYGALVVSIRDAQSLLGVDSFRVVSISAAPGADLAQVATQLARVAEIYGMEANSVENLKRSIAGSVAGLLGVLGGFAVIAMALGVLGTAMVMLMAVTQRVREIAILRTQGMTPRAIRGLFIVEGVILGVVGGCLGILLGGFLSWAIVELSRTIDFDPVFVFSPALALAALGGAVVVAMVAAWYPSTVAARVRIVEALGS